jgi:hypothetical protein
MKLSQIGTSTQARTILPDAEMQSAIDELRQVETMFNNATLGLRQVEANYRVLAAQTRIAAIRAERRGLDE